MLDPLNLFVRGLRCGGCCVVLSSLTTFIFDQDVYLFFRKLFVERGAWSVGICGRLGPLLSSAQVQQGRTYPTGVWTYELSFQMNRPGADYLGMSPPRGWRSHDGVVGVCECKGSNHLRLVSNSTRSYGWRHCQCWLIVVLPARIKWQVSWTPIQRSMLV